MAQEKYISKKNFVNGFSFANLGLFYGFGTGILNAVLSLVLLDIFKSPASVGIYVSIYAAFCMIVTLFSSEFFRHFSKAKLFYISMLVTAVLYFMMAFPVKPATFITLDYATGVSLVLVSILIPLFMADFSKGVGIAKLNGRYHMWLNAGALFSPMIAMWIASNFGNRAAFFAVAAIFAFGLFYFKFMGIVQEEKAIKKVSPRKTIKTLWNNSVSFFKRPELARAYIVNFGYCALSSMRHLYVPIIVIEQGFSKDLLGIILTVGIIPYILLSNTLGRLARKYGNKIWMIIGFVLFALFAFWASFASGYTLLAIFILWQIPGALMEPIHDLLFFDAVKKEEHSKYIGIFRTSANITKFIAPLIGAGFILFFGKTSAVWLLAGIIGLLSAWILLMPVKNGAHK